MDVLQKIKEIGVVPVIALDEPDLAGRLADALCGGGLPIAEVTFRVNNVVDVMRQMKKAHPDMLLGAGTVLKVEQVDVAIEAGCEFIVAPGLNPKVVERCIEKDVPVIPGVATPSEVEQAMSYGLHTLKFFPAELNGGLPYIKALCAPYTNVRFMPTGGVSPANLKNYLSYEKIVAVGGTWIAKLDMIKEEKFAEIEKLAREANQAVKEVR